MVFRNKKIYSQSGQVLLIVVLTMIVALTVGLSIASRVVTELKLSKQNEESQRAFQAAEAGIQQTLENKESINNPILLGNNSQFTTTLISEDGNIVKMNYGLEVDQGLGADVWLSDYSPTPSLLFANPIGNGNTVTIIVYWGSDSQTICTLGSGENTAPALEIIILQGPKSDPTIKKYLFDECTSPTPRTANVDSSSTTDSTIASDQYSNSASVSFTQGLVMKVIPIFNSTKVAVVATGGLNFPPQGSTVESTGVSGDTARKVVYFQSYPQLPVEVFPFSLLSQ